MLHLSISEVLHLTGEAKKFKKKRMIQNKMLNCLPESSVHCETRHRMVLFVIISLMNCNLSCLKSWRKVLLVPCRNVTIIHCAHTKAPLRRVCTASKCAMTLVILKGLSWTSNPPLTTQKHYGHSPETLLKQKSIAIIHGQLIWGICHKSHKKGKYSK